MALLWLLLLLALGLARLPWFAALGAVLLLFAAHVGMDSLLIALEFGRLREFEPILAIPLLWWTARVLTAEPVDLAQTSSRRAAMQDWSGLWLLGQAKSRSSRSLAAMSLLPGVPLLMVWLAMSSVSPARTPDLQELFLASLIPFALLFLLTAVFVPGAITRPADPGPETRGSKTASRILLLVSLVLLAGLYMGRWDLLEAAVAGALLLAGVQLQQRCLAPQQLWPMMLASLRDFGHFALLFGLGLAWIVLAFDSGLNRHWLEPLANLFSGTAWSLLAPGLWLSALWTLAAWKLKPLPALVIGAPWLLTAGLQVGIPAPTLALICVLSLHAGQRLSTGTASGLRPALVSIGLLAATVSILLTAPMLTGWLPAQFQTAGH